MAELNASTATFVADWIAMLLVVTWRFRAERELHEPFELSPKRGWAVDAACATRLPAEVASSGESAVGEVGRIDGAGRAASAARPHRGSR